MIKRPALTILAWFLTAGLVVALAPDLTRLAAESFGAMLPDDAESVVAAKMVRDAWPDRSQGSVLVAVLERPAGLTPADTAYASSLQRAFEREMAREAPLPGAANGHGVVRVLGPLSEPAIAARLTSADKTTQLVVAGFDPDWVAPRASELVNNLEAAAAGLKAPDGLSLVWSGDAALGAEYMGAVHTTLDRAVVVVLVLLLVVLVAVYRSFALAMVPLATVGASLLIARGLVAWLDVYGGIDPNPLVELFLVAVLFGSGTDLVLLLTWRFAEHWDGVADPAAVMAETRRHEFLAIVTTGGTLALALSLLGFMRFRLFSQTGPAVALGMVVGVLASLTLAPALLLVLARWWPRAFQGFRRPGSGFWPKVARLAMSRPLLGWTLGVLALGVPALQAFRVEATYDMVGELPADTPALRGLRTINDEFGPGQVSPLTVVIQTNDDWRDSRGLYLVDDLSQQLADHPSFGEVRSATQPLGSRDELKQARIGQRLAAIREGLAKIRGGADLMASGFTEEAAKIRLLQGFSSYTGFRLPGLGTPPQAPGQPIPGTTPPAPAAPPAAGVGAGAVVSESVEQSQARTMLEKLGQAAQGAKMIADGTAQASRELGVVVDDPVGIQALDRLLLTRENIAANPEIQGSFAEYVSADGKMTRIEVGSTRRMHSPEALDQADELLERAQNFNDDHQREYYKLWVTGPNFLMADVRKITNEDMRWAYVLLPLGIFLALLAVLRDPGVCLNLVLTMLLTYGFTIGVTDWIFATYTGLGGLDWKVKFFTFVLLMAVGVDYNIFLVSRLRQELREHGLKEALVRSIGHTGSLITSAAAITICSYLAFLVSPLHSLRALGFAVALGITIDALVVRTVIMPCGHYLMFHASEAIGRREAQEECDEKHGSLP